MLQVELAEELPSFIQESSKLVMQQSLMSLANLGDIQEQMRLAETQFWVWCVLTYAAIFVVLISLVKFLGQKTWKQASVISAVLFAVCVGGSVYVDWASREPSAAPRTGMTIEVSDCGSGNAVPHRDVYINDVFIGVAPVLVEWSDLVKLLASDQGTPRRVNDLAVQRSESAGTVPLKWGRLGRALDCRLWMMLRSGNLDSEGAFRVTVKNGAVDEHVEDLQISCSSGKVFGPVFKMTMFVPVDE